MLKFSKIIILSIFIILTFSKSYSAEDNFKAWLTKFKKYATSKGISASTVESVMGDAKFLSKVIEYDNRQPEFFEKTNEYISKRATLIAAKKAKIKYRQNKNLFEKIEKEFKIEKELILALWSTETNFGNYLGKMDIISSLATLSYDKRRSEFFTSELITLLILFDNGIINPNNYLGSWAGAFGNFQFMPSTIKNYAIDYNKDETINLKSIEDSFASAANYLNKMGWDNSAPCFFKVELINETPHKYLNTSAKQIKHKNKISYLKKYIKNSEILNDHDNLKAALVTPDYDIIPDANKLTPAYVVFDNYELILKWNRSLRFALAVCTLKSKFKNAI